MISRFMRVMVFFDLPTITDKNRHDYRKFRQFLIQEGFVMMQESVYTKLVLNGTMANLMKKKIRNNKPQEGLIEMLIITEKQFSGIEYVSGGEQENVVDGVENDMIFTEEYINVLQIQDKKLFTNVINSLNDNINNIEDTKERIIILDNDTEIKIEKEVLMIIDVFNIDFNQKKIQNALYNKIEKIYKQEFERMSEFQNVFQKLQLNVLDVFNEFPFEFNYKESIGIQEYLKLLGLKISNNKEKIIDTIFSLIDVVEYLSIAKLLIFVNIKLYLGNDEIQEVYKYAMYKKVNILLIETGEEKEPLENEKILYIDSDYDEIILYNK